ncbi:SDR family oxidoreductase [Pseudovibrio sp. JE062]|uniref:SDR family NAD(P)-dependent oxidoreductase n=1 Tax=Pseudovibrio sp. JE062 TaxID=439495 RepID=UPI000186C11B|nr:SDR family oxidoreductase [Pseudovibrio sp. JE062]EEA91819.1 oxidoreductase, short chain dehydrogenase/reductase family [Pseudovibrio sp. JE062]
MKKNILIIGGTSGVGLELAMHYATEGHTVCVTGRKQPNLEGVTFQNLAMNHDPVQLGQDIDRVLDSFEPVHTLVYAAGFLQRGHIDELEDDDLSAMVNVGLLAPMLLIQRLKKRSDFPLKIMLVTSSSQYTPREMEPAYCATKSGLGMLGASLVRDRSLGKVLVAAPSGIRTSFWDNTNEDTTTMLDPKWVADQIVECSSGRFKYKYAKLLRNPARVEIVECLDNDMAPITNDNKEAHLV